MTILKEKIPQKSARTAYSTTAWENFRLTLGLNDFKFDFMDTSDASHHTRDF